jgi:hypothetical protein
MKRHFMQILSENSNYCIPVSNLYAMIKLEAFLTSELDESELPASRFGHLDQGFLGLDVVTKRKLPLLPGIESKSSGTRADALLDQGTRLTAGNIGGNGVDTELKDSVRTVKKTQRLTITKHTGPEFGKNGTKMKKNQAF